MRKVFRVFMCACLLFSLTACASKSELEALQAENDELNEEIDELKHENKRMKKIIEWLGADLDDFDSDGKPLGSAAADVPAPAPPAEEAPAAPAAKGNKIGIAFPSSNFQRWVMDGESIKSQLAAAGYDVFLQYSDNMPDKQVAAISDMIASGYDLLIVAAVDGDSVSSVIADAKRAGIPVICYDRLVISEGVSYYVTFDSYKIGQIMGQYIIDTLGLDHSAGSFNMEITAGDTGDNNNKFFYYGAIDLLNPYIDSGKLVVRSGQVDYYDVSTPSWSTDEAQYRAENIINFYNSNNYDIDVWLCLNDSTAFGVEKALASSYTGRYPIITGQDCYIENVKNIISGKQSMSVLKNTQVLASQTAKMADQILSGRTVDINDTSTYDAGYGIVPSYLCTPTYVDYNNYKSMLIDSGYYSESDLW